MSIQAATPAQVEALRNEAIQCLAVVQQFVQGSINADTADAALLTEANDAIDALNVAVDAVIAAA